METPNTEFIVELLGLLEGTQGQVVSTQLTSDATISLKSNSSGIFTTRTDFFPLSDVDLLQDNLLIANDAGIIITNDASFAVGNLI